MRVAVTGAAGMLGGFVVRALASEHEVVEIDRVPSPGRHVVLLDVLDLDAVRSAIRGCEAVVHLAAIDQARAAPDEEVLTVNVQGTSTVFLAAEAEGVRRVVHCSSVAALGLSSDWPPLSLPVPIDHPLRPVSAYGLSKHAGEVIAAAFARRGLEVACLRPALITFPHQVAEWAAVAAEADGRAPPPGLRPVPRRVLEPLPLTCAYVSPDDAGRAFAAALRAEFRGPLIAYVTALDTMSARPTADLFADRLRTEPPVTRPELFAALPHATPYDLEPSLRLLGWQPRDSWADVVARYGLA